jgi:hypothetical protein
MFGGKEQKSFEEEEEENFYTSLHEHVGLLREEGSRKLLKH